VLGLLVGAFLASGGGRKWKQRYNAEVARRHDLEQVHATREKEWREQDSLRAAALKNPARDPIADDRRDPLVSDRRDIPAVDRNDDGIIDDRDR
jgi:hypothetical protein